MILYGEAEYLKKTGDIVWNGDQKMLFSWSKVVTSCVICPLKASKIRNVA